MAYFFTWKLKGRVYETNNKWNEHELEVDDVGVKSLALHMDKYV